MIKGGVGLRKLEEGPGARCVGSWNSVQLVSLLNTGTFHGR